MHSESRHSDGQHSHKNIHSTTHKNTAEQRQVPTRRAQLGAVTFLSFFCCETITESSQGTCPHLTLHHGADSNCRVEGKPSSDEVETLLLDGISPGCTPLQSLRRQHPGKGSPHQQGLIRLARRGCRKLLLEASEEHAQEFLEAFEEQAQQPLGVGRGGTMPSSSSVETSPRPRSQSARGATGGGNARGIHKAICTKSLKANASATPPSTRISLYCLSDNAKAGAVPIFKVTR